MSILSFFAVFFASCVAVIFFVDAMKAMRSRRARQYTPPANPQKNLQGLLVVCAVVDTAPGRSGLSNPRREKPLLERVALHDATTVLLPPEMLETFEQKPELLGMPSDIDLVLVIEVTEELVEDQSRGWTDEFAAWLVREYPKARLGEEFSGHTIREKDLMRAYEVTIETVYHKYRHATGKGPYPTMRRTSGKVRFLTSKGETISSSSFRDVTLPPDQFWVGVIEHALNTVRVRRRNGASEVRCGSSKWLPIPHTGAVEQPSKAAKAVENRIALFMRCLPFFSRSSSS